MRLTSFQKFWLLFGISLYVLVLFVTGLYWTLLHPFTGGGPETKVVKIYDNRYFPEIVRVSYGDTVSWQNVGQTDHTVTFRTLSKTLAPGETWNWTITPDYFLHGTNMYWDDLHIKDGMVGARVIVQ